MRAERFGYDIRALTIGRVLADKAAQLGERTFLTFLPDGRRVSYAELDQVTNRIANALLGLGIRPGEHVAVMAENCAEQLFTFFALGKLGAVAVPVNGAARGELLRYFLDQSDAVAFIGDGAALERLTEVRGQLPAIRHALALDEPALSAGAPTPTEVPVRFSDLAYICYTSGTTGPSKGVMFSQARTLLWPLSHAEAFGHRASDVFYVCLPLSHVNGLHGSAYNALMLGASLVLQRRFSASGFWSDIRASGATIANMLGSMVNILWSQPPAPDDADHRLRLSQVNPVPAFALEFEARFDMRMVGGYGLTDYGASHAFTLSDPVHKLGSCGRVRRGMEAKIVDDDDFELPPDTVGELLIRTGNAWEACGGYYKMPEATLASLRNGWFHTGDRARIDADGYMWFVDRKKDTIRRRGENVSAFEVEQALLTHPAVLDAAVYPVSADLAEEEVAASVVLRPGAEAGPAELVEHCARNLAYFMVPRFIHQAADLPRNLSQKVEKYKLRAAVERDLGALWDREQAGIRLARR